MVSEFSFYSKWVFNTPKLFNCAFSPARIHYSQQPGRCKQITFATSVVLCLLRPKGSAIFYPNPYVSTHSCNLQCPLFTHIIVEKYVVWYFLIVDVYSYDEDCMVKDPYLAKHLSHFGINIASLEKVLCKFRCRLHMIHTLSFPHLSRNEYWNIVSLDR